MARLFLRKIGLMVLLLPILNWVGFNYARFQPQMSRRLNVEEIEFPSYTLYLQGLWEGNLGRVGQNGIEELVPPAFISSLVLIVLALLFTAVLGVGLGFAAVSSRQKRITPAGLVLTTAGASLPGFLLGGVVISIMVYMTLYGGLKSFPLRISGFGWDERLILPLLVLALRPTLHVAKITANLLEHELHQEYIRTAQSKGLPWLYIYWGHGFRNILAPVIVVLGQSLRLMVGGLLIAEMMFSWPGIGRQLVFAIIANQNFTSQRFFYANPELLAALAVLMGFLLLTADLIASVSAYLADPRLREKS